MRKFYHPVHDLEPNVNIYPKVILQKSVQVFFKSDLIRCKGKLCFINDLTFSPIYLFPISWFHVLFDLVPLLQAQGLVLNLKDDLLTYKLIYQPTFTKIK